MLPPGRFQVVNDEHGHDARNGQLVHGLDLTQPVSDALRKQLNADFARYHVLAIRDQTFTPARFLQAGRVFGEIMPHHRKSGDTTSDSSIFEVKNEEVAPGKFYVAGETFHTDHSNDPARPKRLHCIRYRSPAKGEIRSS